MNSLFLNSSATFSPCRTYRYTLTRVWDEKLPLCVWVMLNPSTADEVQDDPTIRRCQDFADRWRMGGALITNLFALRSTAPRALYKHDAPIGPDNDQAILEAAQKGGLVVAAWGVHGKYMDRGEFVMEILKANGIAVKCLKKTKDGLPVHPLYQPSSAVLIDL